MVASSVRPVSLLGDPVRLQVDGVRQLDVASAIGDLLLERKARISDVAVVAWSAPHAAEVSAEHPRD